MEEAFSQLKQITGVSTLVDMHEKFSSQKGNKGSLLQEVKDAEARLEAAKIGQIKYEQTFQELKSSVKLSDIKITENGIDNHNNNNNTSSNNNKSHATMQGIADQAVATSAPSSSSSPSSLIEEPSRESNDQLEHTIAAAKNDCKAARAAYERLSAVLLGRCICDRMCLCVWNVCMCDCWCMCVCL